MLKVSLIQNEFMRSSFLPKIIKFQPKITEIFALPSNKLPGQKSLTPPNSEIICGQNVSTKVVCGMILFFEKKSMLKI